MISWCAFGLVSVLATSAAPISSDRAISGTGRVQTPASPGISSDREAILLRWKKAREAALGEKEELDDDAEWSFFPILVYAPETSFLFGGLALFTFRVDPAQRSGDGQLSRRSSLTNIVGYSLKNQFVFRVNPNLYFDGETWNVQTDLRGAWYPDKAWEVGNAARADSEENVSRRLFALFFNASRSVVANMRFGLKGMIGHVRYTDVEPGGLIDTGQVPGAAGGYAVGAGPILLWDSRDNDFSAYRGGRYELSTEYYREELGSTFNYTAYTADLRHYFLLPWSHVVAGQAYARFVDGGVPFETMSKLGGNKSMRGFYEGRYIDRNLVAGQLEYRLPLFWRFGLAAFGAVGRVSHGLNDLGLGGFRGAGGAGLRWALSPRDRANLRLDFAATSNGDFAFYFDLGEAF